MLNYIVHCEKSAPLQFGFLSQFFDYSLPLSKTLCILYTWTASFRSLWGQFNPYLVATDSMQRWSYRWLIVWCLPVQVADGMMSMWTGGWWYDVYLYRCLMVWCLPVQVADGMMSTCTGGWWYDVYVDRWLMVWCLPVQVADGMMSTCTGGWWYAVCWEARLHSQRSCSS